MAGKTTKKVAQKKTAQKKTANAPRKVTKKATAKTTRKTATKKTAASSSTSASAVRQIEKKIASLKDWRGERLAEIRRLIHEVDPDVIEDWKWMGTPVWSNNGMYVLANAHKEKVKITFQHGAHLRDPEKLFNNGLGGKQWRAIDIFESDRINKTAFKALLREAIAYNTTHAVPKSKGSCIR